MSFFQTKKVKKASEYVEHAQHMKSLSQSPNVFDDLIEQANGQISEWKQKLDVIADRLKSKTMPEFHEVQDFVMDRLSSYACSKHQGYVMQGFELDAEMASFLFIEPGEDMFEFNSVTKPDYVIIMNRLMDPYDECNVDEKNFGEATVSDEQNEMKDRLRKY